MCGEQKDVEQWREERSEREQGSNSSYVCSFGLVLYFLQAHTNTEKEDQLTSVAIARAGCCCCALLLCVVGGLTFVRRSYPFSPLRN